MFLFPKSINDMHMSFIIEVGVCNEYKAKEYKARYHNTPTIPIRGTASLVLGMTEETMFINTVRDRRIVTPETNTSTVNQLSFAFATRCTYQTSMAN